jgi:hypothetical protein
MYAARTIAILSLLALVAVGAAAQDKGKGKGKGKGKEKDRDDVVGAIWHYTLSRGGQVVTGNFRVYQQEMFRGDKRIGVIKAKDNDEATFIVSGDPELNGQAHYRKTHDKPQRVKGTLVRPTGEKWDLEIEVKDR